MIPWIKHWRNREIIEGLNGFKSSQKGRNTDKNRAVIKTKYKSSCSVKWNLNAFELLVIYVSFKKNEKNEKSAEGHLTCLTIWYSRRTTNYADGANDKLDITWCEINCSCISLNFSLSFLICKTIIALVKLTTKREW